MREQREGFEGDDGRRADDFVARAARGDRALGDHLLGGLGVAVPDAHEVYGKHALDVCVGDLEHGRDSVGGGKGGGC